MVHNIIKILKELKEISLYKGKENKWIAVILEHSANTAFEINMIL